MREDKPVNRRRFFREGLRELIKPLSEMIEPLEQAMHQLGRMEQAFPAPAGDPYQHHHPAAAAETPATNHHPGPHWLRPPGALEERSFRDTCSRCGKCVEVCPAQCIKIDSTGVKGFGAPYIEPDVMPCVVCDGLVCMRDCPSGALVPTALGLIDMGTAAWHADLCVRSRGEECTVCIDRCPIGSVAIELVEGRIEILDAGCTGCGVCQNHCPTIPKSIVVVPRGAR
jgi:ferredoxin-type protein NapG